MGNHSHLLIETPDGNLSEGIRQLNGISTEIQPETRKAQGWGMCFWVVQIHCGREGFPPVGVVPPCRHVVLNPVRVGMTWHPKDHPWSSYCVTAGLKKKSAFLSADWILARFGNDRRHAQQEYRRFILAGMGVESRWKRLVGQCLLEGESFLENVLPFLRKKTGFSDISRVQRYALRPPLEKAFPGGQSKPDRHKAIATAHIEHGYSKQSLAAQLGLHYATVSGIIQRKRDTIKNKT